MTEGTFPRPTANARFVTLPDGREFCLAFQLIAGVALGAEMLVRRPGNQLYDWVGPAIDVFESAYDAGVAMLKASAIWDASWDALAATATTYMLNGAEITQDQYNHLSESDYNNAIVVTGEQRVGERINALLASMSKVQFDTITAPWLDGPLVTLFQAKIDQYVNVAAPAPAPTPPPQVTVPGERYVNVYDVWNWMAARVELVLVGDRVVIRPVKPIP